jgi:hypothetical protein
MAEARPFLPVKLIAGVIFSNDDFLELTAAALVKAYGLVDRRSPVFPFKLTDYYEKQMGPGLKRIFLSFEQLVSPEKLSTIKLQTNAMEDSFRRSSGEGRRVVNIDPGILSASALVMATTKDFAHRVPLAEGIYGHLEFLFAKGAVKILDWTYPDFRQPGYQTFFLEIRRVYLAQLKRGAQPGCSS